ncbi:MAG: hypothetical protein GY947_18045 [Rhodobacteraceae bacterium]|nr:hypothetical protein [Paracoccaceae bacterium]
MKRRIFLQGVTALAADPALPATAFTGSETAPAALAWARYLSARYSGCTRQMLQTALRKSASEAQSTAIRLASAGVLNPAQITSPPLTGPSASRADLVRLGRQTPLPKVEDPPEPEEPTP